MSFPLNEKCMLFKLPYKLLNYSRRVVLLSVWVKAAFFSVGGNHCTDFQLAQVMRISDYWTLGPQQDRQYHLLQGQGNREHWRRGNGKHLGELEKGGILWKAVFQTRQDVVVSVNSQQLWLPAPELHKTRCFSSQCGGGRAYKAPSLSEDLQAVNGCQRGGIH